MDKSKFSKQEIEHLTRKGLRWRVEFDYEITPGTKKNYQFTHGINHKFKGPENFHEKRKTLLAIRQAYEELLDTGKSPVQGQLVQSKYSAIDSLNWAVEELTKSTANASTSSSDYKVRKNVFTEWLLKNGHKNTPIELIDKKTVSNFLDAMAKKSSASNRNNYKRTLSAIFTFLRKKDLVYKNPFDDIDLLKSKPRKHRSYLASQEKEITELLEANDPNLGRFVRVFSYQFLRPIDTIRIKAKNVYLKDRILFVDTKTTGDEKKRIPEILVNDYQYLLDQSTNPEDFLFTPLGPGSWELKEGDKGKRDYFTTLYNKRVKKPLNLESEYDMYSHRHTKTEEVYRHLYEIHDGIEEKVLNELMKITGHASLAGLRKYLRSIRAQLPGDYSDLLK